ncbi:MAG: 4Fe-4S dicluster domain-containing protein [Conexivisphaera sp.]|jgi:protein NrfC
MRLGFLWDMTLCVSCGACVTACSAANYPDERWMENRSWDWLTSNILLTYYDKPPTGRAYSLITSCQQCENPPCVGVCPTGASYIDKDTGLVLIDYDKCIGCRYCMAACPYGMRWLDQIHGWPNKCPGPDSQERISNGQNPACVEVCPTGARLFGDLDDPNSEISIRLKESTAVRLLEDKGTEPKYFVVVGRSQVAAAHTSQVAAAQVAQGGGE